MSICLSNKYLALLEECQCLTWTCYLVRVSSCIAFSESMLLKSLHIFILQQFSITCISVLTTHFNLAVPLPCLLVRSTSTRQLIPRYFIIFIYIAFPFKTVMKSHFQFTRKLPAYCSKNFNLFGNFPFLMIIINLYCVTRISLNVRIISRLPIYICVKINLFA